MRKRLVLASAVITTLSIIGCGDPATSDTRPLYSKAPLERPGVRIKAEVPSAMAGLGTPNLIPTVSTEPVE